MEEMISVVIPTINRPLLVVRAVSSALAQTYKNIEVIVVVDGPDEATVRTLERMDDPRLRVLPLVENVGGSGARNAGVRVSKGSWVAFLDDDDEWLPEKLTEQMELTSDMHGPFGIVSCAALIVTPGGHYLWPRRLPESHQSISEYLFVRDSVFQGEGYVLTPTLLMRKELLEHIPFRSDLRKHQDWDWLLRAAQLDGFSLKMAPKPLVKVYWEEARKSIGSTNHWKYSLEWLHSNHALFTPSAYSGFIATQVVPSAAKQHEWKAFAPLLLEMYRLGKPRAFDLLLYLGYWLVPQSARRRIRAACMGGGDRP